MKVCSTCKSKKDYSMFGKRSITIDGYRYQCKMCERKVREMYLLNPANWIKILNYRKEFYSKNKKNFVEINESGEKESAKRKP